MTAPNGRWPCNAKIYADTFGVSCIYCTRTIRQSRKHGRQPEITGLHLAGHSGTLRNIIHDLPSTGAGILVRKAVLDFQREPESEF